MLTIIGQGNVGTHIAARARQLGLDVQVWTRSEGTPIPSAEAYLLCVKDAAIASVACQLPQDAVVMHTSGSTPLDVLPQARRGVIYPMQTFSKSKALDWSKIPLFVEGDSMAQQFAESLQPASVQHLATPQRLQLHMAAVWACNFANHCISIGADIMQQAGLDWRLLMPLIGEMTGKLDVLTPREAQTGPARRQDSPIMTLHEQALVEMNRPELADLYTRLSQSIIYHSELPQ